MRRNWLIIKRMEKGYLQHEVAEMMGISKGHYSNIERGARNPEGSLAYKMSKALDFDMNLFYEEKATA